MSPTIELRSNGQKLNDPPVVPADLIALVAGVSFGSVVKVLLAVNAISAGLKTPLQTLVALDAIPEVPANGERFGNTDKAAAIVARSPTIEDYESTLHFIERHNRLVKGSHHG
jgi:hypothetical protein